MTGDEGCHGECEHPAGHYGPCGYPSEAPGTPCRYCGQAVPMDGSPCPKCWVPVTAENAQAIADELSFAVEVAQLNRAEGYDPSV